MCTVRNKQKWMKRKKKKKAGNEGGTEGGSWQSEMESK